MFCLKISPFLKSKVFVGYIDNYCGCIKEKQCLWILQRYNYSYCINIDKNDLYAALCSRKTNFNIRHLTSVQNDISVLHSAHYNKGFCTNTSPKDVFGNISYDEYEKVPMDKAEQEEENYGKSTKRVPRWQKLSYREYCKLIKKYMEKKDVNLALSVLDLMKENGDRPTIFIYRLLLSAFALQGDVKQCFKLFRKIRNSGIVPTPHVYTSLIQACANAQNSKIAVERLDFLRRYFFEKKINLNVVQYCALIKAYGRHNQVLTAFQIADEARDNGIFANSMATFLFHATISDKQSGLKYALALWHKMRKEKMKVNILHYNLLLRAIRDTQFGDLKVNDSLLLKLSETQIVFKDVERSDLLDSPPVLSTSLISMLKESTKSMINTNSSEIDVIDNNYLLLQNLDKILNHSRLFLFGGIEKFFKRMENDGVTPDTKTITLVLELLPPTLEAESAFLKYLEQKHISVDITFFNMLIKKRCMRRSYEDAKNVLNDIQRYHFTPNIITFGVLAIGCRKFKDGTELLEQMNNIGFVPNYTIIETLLLNACVAKSFIYVSYMMKYILDNQIKPSTAALRTLQIFDEVVLRDIENKDKFNKKPISFTKANYNKFKINYESWKEKLQIDTDY